MPFVLDLTYRVLLVWNKFGKIHVSNTITLNNYTMKKLFLLACLTLVLSMQTQAQIYSTSTGKVSFFSKTPVEDIDALSSQVVTLLNTKTGDVVMKIANTSFVFPNKLMQEHFNEKYMESETYPNSTFAGKINETIDYTKDGSYDVSVTGKLNIHGVEQLRTIKGKVIIKGETIQLLSDFMVKNVDHKIQIPQLVMAKIAEELTVKVDAILVPKK